MKKLQHGSFEESPLPPRQATYKQMLDEINALTDKFTALGYTVIYCLGSYDPVVKFSTRFSPSVSADCAGALLRKMQQELFSFTAARWHNAPSAHVSDRYFWITEHCKEYQRDLVIGLMPPITEGDNCFEEASVFCSFGNSLGPACTLQRQIDIGRELLVKHSKLQNEAYRDWSQVK